MSASLEVFGLNLTATETKTGQIRECMREEAGT